MDFATPRVFATARNDPDEIDDTYGTKLEIKIYESRYNSHGSQVRLQARTRRTELKLKEQDIDPGRILVTL